MRGRQIHRVGAAAWLCCAVLAILLAGCGPAKKVGGALETAGKATGKAAVTAGKATAKAATWTAEKVSGKDDEPDDDCDNHDD